MKNRIEKLNKPINDWAEENNIDKIIEDIKTHLEHFEIDTPEFKRLLTYSIRNIVLDNLIDIMD